MRIDPGRPIQLDGQRHDAVAQWELRDSGTKDRPVHIQVGMLNAGDWYVNHVGFGARQFADKQTAWLAVQRLMGLHEGRWERVEHDSEPFLAVRRPDGARVIIDDIGGACLRDYWGAQQDRLSDKFTSAIDAGRTLRRTRVHGLLGGEIRVVRYRSPLDGCDRYAVLVDEGPEYCLMDYADRAPAELGYENEVRELAQDEFPYRSSDVADIPVDELSSFPDNEDDEEDEEDDDRYG